MKDLKRDGEWLLPEPRKQAMITRLIAAMDIVQEANRVFPERPGARYDGRFLWPGNAIAWAMQLRIVFQAMGDDP